MFPAYAYLSAYDRHKKLINDYFTLYGGSVSSLKRDTSRDKTDYDVIRENHRFLWDQDNDKPETWGARLAKKYYDKLFKEYCIADLMYYKQNKVALRWRTEKEVIVGKGQFECGNKKCKEKEDLKSWEVNFGYLEQGQKKNALVKLSKSLRRSLFQVVTWVKYRFTVGVHFQGLCPECSTKLNYRSQKHEAKKHKTLKRLGTNMPSTSTVEIKIEEDEGTNNSEKLVETREDESNIWKEKPVDNLEKTREEEFEEYLADLLM